jgi:hypothetical protein
MDQTNMHDNEPSMLLRKKPGFLCLLSSMLFSTLTAAPKMRVRVVLEEENIPDTGEMHFAAMVSANLTGFPRQPSMYTLAAYIFAQSQFSREEEFAYAPDFISTTFRIALCRVHTCGDGDETSALVVYLTSRCYVVELFGSLTSFY